MVFKKPPQGVVLLVVILFKKKFTDLFVLEKRRQTAEDRLSGKHTTDLPALTTAYGEPLVLLSLSLKNLLLLLLLLPPPIPKPLPYSLPLCHTLQL